MANGPKFLESRNYEITTLTNSINQLSGFKQLQLVPNNEFTRSIKKSKIIIIPNTNPEKNKVWIEKPRNLQTEFSRYDNGKSEFCEEFDQVVLILV